MVQDNRRKKIVILRWFDAHYDNGTLSDEEIKDIKPYIMESGGFLVEETKDYIRFAAEWCEKLKHWRYTHSVPKVNIIRKRIIKCD